MSDWLLVASFAVFFDNVLEFQKWVFIIHIFIICCRQIGPGWGAIYFLHMRKITGDIRTLYSHNFRNMSSQGTPSAGRWSFWQRQRDFAWDWKSGIQMLVLWKKLENNRLNRKKGPFSNEGEVRHIVDVVWATTSRPAKCQVVTQFIATINADDLINADQDNVNCLINAELHQCIKADRDIADKQYNFEVELVSAEED